jgi:hypothetical protein
MAVAVLLMTAMPRRSAKMMPATPESTIAG